MMELNMTTAVLAVLSISVAMLGYLLNKRWESVDADIKQLRQEKAQHVILTAANASKIADELKANDQRIADDLKAAAQRIADELKRSAELLAIELKEHNKQDLEVQNKQWAAIVAITEVVHEVKGFLKIH